MIVCADDYGLRDDIDRGILELCRAGKLSAVSCLVALEQCTSSELGNLKAYQSVLDLGLHLCLTDAGLPLSPSPVASAAQESWPAFRVLLRSALLGRVEPHVILQRIAAQYRLFVQKCGRSPDFIDGHLHVHQFPRVRTALVEFIKSLPESSRPYIRNTHLPLRALWSRRLPWLKSALLGVFGAPMLKELQAAGVRTNQGFAGIYDFHRNPNFGEYLPRFVGCLPEPNGILVVHPGADEDWRSQEFAALREFAFPAGNPHRFLHEGSPSRPTA